MNFVQLNKKEERLNQGSNQLQHIFSDPRLWHMACRQAKKEFLVAGTCCFQLCYVLSIAKLIALVV